MSSKNQNIEMSWNILIDAICCYSHGRCFIPRAEILQDLDLITSRCWNIQMEEMETGYLEKVGPPDIGSIHLQS